MPSMRFGRRRITVLAVSLLVAGAGLNVGSSADAAVGSSSGTAAARIAPVMSCASLAGLELARVETSVASATEVTRGGHRYCSVTGYISPQTRFEVLLPTSTWRGDYLQQGCGGFCGFVNLP